MYEIILEFKQPLIVNGIKTDYYITNYGTIINKNNHIMTPVLTKDGYYKVNLYVNGKYIRKKVHQYVAETFIPNPENKPTVNHIDGNKLNNYVGNLEWATYKEQNIHAYKMNLMHTRKGQDSHFAIVNEKTVHKICKMLESGKYTKKDIASKLKISKHIVNNIVKGLAWVEISKSYNISKYKRSKPTGRKPQKLTKELVIEIRRLRKLEYTAKQIQKELPTYISIDSIRDVYLYRTWKNI